MPSPDYVYYWTAVGIVFFSALVYGLFLLHRIVKVLQALARMAR